MEDTETVIYKFAYERSLDHRTVCASGAWIAITGDGVQIALFNDLHRLPSPDSDIKVDLVREVHTTVLVNVEVAKRIATLLNYMVAKAEKSEYSRGGDT